MKIFLFLTLFTSILFAEKPPLLVIVDTGVGEKCIAPSGLLHGAFVSNASFDLWQNRSGFRDQSGHGSHVAGVVWQQV